ncbi:MAG: hypothetical protein QOH08_2037 [Chloroflexota bacterium]|nr:hypothetical protein [Chloroflexota bacterium]
MSTKLALTIGAVVALIAGIGFTLAPAQLLSGFGLNAPNEALIVTRDIGVTLVGLGILNWLARDATGPAVRAIIIGNLFIQAAELVVNGWEIAAGSIPSQAAPGIVLHLALGIVFLLALRRA